MKIIKIIKKLDILTSYDIILPEVDIYEFLGILIEYVNDIENIKIKDVKEALKMIKEK